MKISDIRIGIEIEANVNSEIAKDFEVFDYHNGENTNFLHWKCESDSSIHPCVNTSFESYQIEFISNRLNGKKGFFCALGEFKKSFDKYQLSKALHFNKSCGVHFHISFKNHSFIRHAHKEIFLSTRREFFKLLRKSNISSKAEIRQHYFRSYAKRVLLRDKLGACKEMDKYREFNFRSEYNGYGLEWRSPSLLNIKSWEEYDEFFKIIWKCIIHLKNKSARYTFKESLNFQEEPELNTPNIIHVPCAI